MTTPDVLFRQLDHSGPDWIVMNITYTVPEDTCQHQSAMIYSGPEKGGQLDFFDDFIFLFLPGRERRICFDLVHQKNILTGIASYDDLVASAWIM